MRKASQLLVAVTLVAMTGGCSMNATADDSGDVEPRPAPTAPISERPTVSVLVVGDSLASGGPWDAIPGDPGSWTYYLGTELDVVGGWRRDGATSALIASSMPAESADALILMAGTNDVRRDLPLPGLIANLETIVSLADVNHVVIAAIPPADGFADEVRAANAAFQNLADARGWTWVDAWMLYRTDDGWGPNGSLDGVHGSEASYRSAGSAITQAVLDASFDAPRDG